MTKEAILEKWLPTPEGAYETNDIVAAMDEYAALYAKQQAILFAEYVSNNEYTLCLTPEGWIRLGESITTVKTSQQLYNQFIGQQNKDNEI